MGLEALESEGQSELVRQDQVAALRPRLGQKEPAGQGPQLPSEVPPA